MCVPLGTGRSSKARGHSGHVRIKFKVVGAKSLWLDTAYRGSFTN